MINSVGLLADKTTVHAPDAQRDPNSKMVERRKSNRFPINQDLQFRVIRRDEKWSGVGRTLNFSSHGILFWSKDPLRPGSVLEVSVNWPARLDGNCAMKIVAEGPVVRVEGNHAAIRITRYEFRTRSSRTAVAALDSCA